MLNCIINMYKQPRFQKNKQTKNKQTKKKNETITFPERTSKINVMLSPILILNFLAPATT